MVDLLIAIFCVKFRSNTEPNFMNEDGLSGTGISFGIKLKILVGTLLKRVCLNPMISNVYATRQPNILVREYNLRIFVDR